MNRHVQSLGGEGVGGRMTNVTLHISLIFSVRESRCPSTIGLVNYWHIVLQPIYLFEVKSLCLSYRSSISIRLNFYGGDAYAG